MGDFAPTAAIVRAMQAKVDAEEVLRIHIRDLQANYTELQGHPNQLEAARPTTTRTTTSPTTPISTSSWQVTPEAEITQTNLTNGYEYMDQQHQQ